MRDDGGFREFYSTEFRSLWSFAYLLCRDPVQAEELAQDAMVRTYYAWERVRDRDRPDLYARAALLNLQRSLWRRATKLRALTPRLADPDIASGGYDEDRAELWSALSSCSRRQREALVLRFYEDMTEAEIARVLECPVGTVKSLLHRGLERLRTRMGADAEIATAGGEVR